MGNDQLQVQHTHFSESGKINFLRIVQYFKFPCKAPVHFGVRYSASLLLTKVCHHSKQRNFYIYSRKYTKKYFLCANCSSGKPFSFLKKTMEFSFDKVLAKTNKFKFSMASFIGS